MDNNHLPLKGSFNLFSFLGKAVTINLAKKFLSKLN